MKNFQMQMLQNMGIVKQIWSVKILIANKLNMYLAKKKWSQDSLVSMMSREWLKDPSSNLG